eukprot:CAMPEP_0206266248 /NCGR_PEP_ID=MMETSP0047_2-20121206/30463_1 /ASSEMBLY_ACC=CAM_ASM_000192 /TAXON_ID=195065 /ORGANISM="Chroomonas mesostigmatica_cf, Strain CCMP1168" /LENGTH=60 /DNA_ID=CAMNT_0053694269 /DNA_START=1 /DNA_END=180 /DNA_ORIENTATION=+
MVTTPWATMHPLRLEREEKRDETLVEQAKLQREQDSKLLDAARTMHEHDQRLVKQEEARG